MRQFGKRAAPFVLALTLALVLAVSSFVSPLSVAADNGLTVTKTVDGNPLIGGTTTYTITVANNSFAAGANNPDGKAYNLDITDALPIGVIFSSAKGGDGASASPVITTVQTGVAPNQIPQQTVKFTNLTDIARNQTYTFTLVATLNPHVMIPGTQLANTATATVANDPRAAATIAAGSATANSTALPFKLTKKANQSTGVSQDTGGCSSGTAPGKGRDYSYDLIATNNNIGPSSNMVITDTLPNGIEYCGTSAGGITPTVTTNADGTTTLVYSLGTLATGAVKTVSPAVAIRYTYQKDGTLIVDDTQLTNTADMTGTYNGTNYDTGNQTATVKAKYATIAKGSDHATVTYGDTVKYTLTPSTSTNYDISNEYVVDTIPNGQEYNAGSATINGTAFAPTDDAATDGIYTACAGTHPSAGVYICNDGTTQVTWGKINNAALTPTTAGTQYTITYTVTQDSKYLHGTGNSILATDSFRNSATVTYDAASIAGNASQPNSVTRHTDTASAGQGTKPPQISKIVTAVTRADGGATEGKVSDPKNSTAAVGDITTFQISYTGSTNADQGSIIVSDFLPTNYQYVAGSAVFGGTYSGTVAQSCSPDCATNGAILIFGLNGDSGTANATKINDTFVVTLKAQAMGGNAGNGNTNLGKFSGVNTASAAYSGRDQTATTTLAPQLQITKSNDANPNPAKGNQQFNYTVVLKNVGNSTAYQIADLVDTLPPDIKYLADVSITSSPAGTGTATAGVYTPSGTGYGGSLKYGGIGGASNSLAPGASITFKYSAQVQPQPQTGAVDTNDATIQTYVSQPTGTTKTYGPVSGKNNVSIGAGQITKTGTIHSPQVNDTNGKALTVGDQVDYTLTFLLPANQTFPSGAITDCLPTGFHYTASSYSATTGRTLPGPGALPANDTAAGFSKASGSGTPCAAGRELVTIGFGDQVNNSDPIAITVKLSATITGKDQAGATVFSAVPNTQSDPNSAYAYAGTSPQGSATSPALTINRPSLVLTKTLARPTTPTTAGAQYVDFLVQVQNNGGSPAYDIVPLVDTLDSGLTFVAAYTSDSTCQTAAQAAGVTAAGQVITIPVPGPLAPNATFGVCVRTTVGPPAAPSTNYKNGVTLGTGNGNKYYSGPSSFPSRAGYTQDSNPTAQVRTPDVTVMKGEKSGRPSPDGKAVPGEVISFTLQFTIPAGTTLYKPTVIDGYDFSQATPQLASPVNTTAGGTSLSCTNGASGPFTFAVTNGHATYSFAGNLTAGAGDAVCTLQLDTKVTNSKPANVAGATVTNPNFQIGFKDNNGTAVSPVTSNRASVTLTEPNVTIAKTLASNWGADGRATFDITLTNATGANASTAYDVNVTDNLPTGLIFVSGTTSTTGAATNPVIQHGPPPSDPAYKLNGNSLVFTADSIAPGASATYKIVVVSDIAPPPGTVLTNTANETYYDLPNTTNNNSNQMDPLSRRAYTGTSSAPITLPPVPTTNGGGPNFVWAFVRYTDNRNCMYPNTTVPIFVRITDTRSEIVDYPQVTFVKPDGSSATTVEFKKLVSGTRNDGIYEADVYLDQYAPAGNYKITQLYAFDKLGNQIRQDVNNAVDISSPITVCSGTNTGGGGACNAMDPPKYTSSTIAYPNGGTTVSPGGSVTVTVHLTSCSGIIDPSITYVKPDGSDGPHADFKMIGGNVNDGDWQTTVLLDQYSPAGTYKVKELRAFDLYNTVIAQSAKDPADAIATKINITVAIGAPTITSLSPDSGPVSGGTRITITGTGFRTGATVKFGTVAGGDPQVLSGTTITVTVPNLASGDVIVVVTNPDGQASSGTATGHNASGTGGTNTYTAVQSSVGAKPTAGPGPGSTGGIAPAPAAKPSAPTAAPSGTAGPTPVPQPARH